MNKSEETCVSNILLKLKNNKIISFIIIFGIIVISVGQFTDALQKIKNFSHAFFVIEKDRNDHNNNHKNKTFYDVTISIPSWIEGAEVFVDGKEANVIQQISTIIKIRVEKKDTAHKIIVKKGEIACPPINILIREQIKQPLTPCL